MNVLVVGATGGSGRAVCTALLERGHQVTALARRATALPAQAGLQRHDGDATDATTLEHIVPGHDAVVVTLGISEPALRVRLRGAARTANNVRSRGTQAVIEAARRAGIRRVVVQTSYGVGPTRRHLGFVDRLVLTLLLGPQMADTALQEDIVRASGLDWTLVQPVYLTDAPSETSFTSTDGRTRARQVSRRGLALVHAALLEDGSRRGQTVSVSG